MNLRRSLLVLLVVALSLGALLLRPRSSAPTPPATSLAPAPTSPLPFASAAAPTFAPAPRPISAPPPPPPAAALLAALRAGRPLTLALGDQAPRRFGFRPATLTTPDFRISAGASPEARLPAEFAVFSGREFLGAAGLGAPAALAIVDGQIALGITLDGVNYLAEIDPDTGLLLARPLAPLVSAHDDHDHALCTEEHGLATLTAPSPPDDAPALPVALTLTADSADSAPEIAEALVDHPHYRHGPRYAASLRDIVVLWASAKSQTGPASGLASRAAGYLVIAARTADVYERQLGLRYLLQELILIPSDSTETDIVETSLGATELERWEAWLATHRPKSAYKWGHAAAWNLVDGAAGGTVGRAYVDAFGRPDAALSTQERAFGWEVHAHELGHNVGASHTNGGLMNPSLISNNENLFTQSSAGSYTGAKDIHNYMANNRDALADQYGPALLRDPAQIPFAIDDLVAAPAGATVRFAPLANDQTSVLLGATNRLRLVEVGSVYPLAAGEARVIGDEIEFTPAPGFTGQAWFTYTLGGDVGNAGAGWLHAADLSVNVGGSSAPPGLAPALLLRDDILTSEFLAPVRINPLLNDQASGRLWAGDVEVRSAPGQATPATYSENAFQLVSAQLLAGRGALALETRPAVRSALAAEAPGGYLLYTPGPLELDQVLIRYTARDAAGATATALIEINRAATVALSADAARLSSVGGRVLALTATRNAVAPRDSAETVSFAVTGDGGLLGSAPDFAIAGAAGFDPATGLGTVVIPAGADSVSWYLTPARRPLDAPTRRINIRLTAASTLQLATASQVNIELGAAEIPLLETFNDFTSINSGTPWSTPISGSLARWEVKSGSTTVSDTGPDGGYPDGSGKYLYVTANGRSRPSTATLLSPAYDLSGLASATLDFAYHMQGVDLGTLRLDVFARGAWTNDVVALSGQQSTSGLDWKLRRVDLAPYLASDFRLRFRYNIVTSGIKGDAAIDQLLITAAPAGPARAPLVLTAPLARDLPPGAPLYLALAADAFPAPSYQWKLDGLAIPGATAPAYQVAALSTADAGRYTVEIRSGDASTTALVAELRVGGVGGDPGYQGEPGEDPDADGLPNLLEVALGSDPDEPGSTAALVPELDDQGRLRLSFLRASATLTYTVQASSDLATWTDLAVNPGVVGETVTVTDAEPAAPRRFLRLRVSLPPGPE